MAARLFAARAIAGSREWNRRRLQILLAVSALVALALTVGVLWSVITMFRSHGDAGGGPSHAATEAAAIKVEEASADDFAHGPLSTDVAGSLTVPQAGGLGPAQVATGFPPTPEGALAQLIAIDKRAIESVSLVTAQDVISAWAVEGGPSATSWSGVEAMAIMLDTAGLPANGSPELQVELRPTLGFLRDSTGDGTTPCVDFVMVTSVLDAKQSEVSVADCQHMIWVGGRWMIGPGPEAEPAPSLWPGTQASYDAGYQWLEVAP
jgi:hypothetical protein